MSRPRPWIIYLCVVATLVGAAAFATLNLGEWLIVQDPLQPASAIVVLSGELPERAIEAARIYRQNAAPQVWISPGLSPAARLEEMHIAYLGEDFFDQKVLMAQGVPADAIHILQQPAANTLEEVDEIARDLRARNEHVVIVVSSKAHTRRVRTIWRRRVGDDPRLVVRYAATDRFDAAHWWRTSSSALDVVREVLGLVNAWLGFPARPEAH